MIKLNYFNCLKDEYVKNGLKLNEIQNNKYEKELKKAIINKVHLYSTVKVKSISRSVPIGKTSNRASGIRP